MSWATQSYPGLSSLRLDALMRKRRNGTTILKWTVLALALIIVLDDEPTVWDKTLTVTQKILFGGLFSD